MEPDELLERLREAPERAAIILDVDGVLAPIVDRPEDARVPDETREEYPALERQWVTFVRWESVTRSTDG